MSSGVQGGLSVNKFQQHALRDAASGLGVMSPDMYLSVVSAAQKNFLSRMSQIASQAHDGPLAAASSHLDDMPQLLAPGDENFASPDAAESPDAVQASGSDAPARGAAALTALLGRIMSIMSANSVSRLQQNAALWNQLADAVKAKLESLGRAFDDATRVATDATDAAEAARESALDAESDAAKSREVANQADRAYQEKKGSGASEQDLKPYRDDAQKKGAAADKADGNARQVRADANAAKDAAVGAATNAASAESEMNRAAEDAKGARSSIKVASEDTPMRGAAALTEIFARVQELISSGNLDELSSKQRLFQEMQSQREESLKKKSAEYEEQVRKAEQLQKTMGCVGKMVGWIVVAVSVVAAAFSGGASLALAAVGLALAVGDEISQAATGVSFMEKAMQPIMDAVLKPLMNFFAQRISAVLEACGVDKETAAIAGAIVGAVVTGVALIVAALIGSSIVKSVISKVADVIASQLAKVMESAIGKALLQVLEKAMEKSGLQALMSSTTTAMERLGIAIGVETQEEAMLVGTRLECASIGVNVANQCAQAAGGIVVGVEQNHAMQTLAAVKMAMNDLKMIGGLLRKAVENFAEHNRVLSQLLQDMTGAASTEASTGGLILRNARAV